MIDLKALKHDLCRRFDISSDDIEDGHLPTLHIVDQFHIEKSKKIDLEIKKINELVKKIEHKTTESVELEFNKINELVNKIEHKTTQSIIFEGKDVAAYYSFAKYGLLFVGLSILLSAYFLGISWRESKNMGEYNHLKKLSQIVRIDQNNKYFIAKDKYTITKKGIILN